MPKTDDIAQMGVSLNADGHLVARYIAPDGSKQTVDLTAEIDRIADEKVKAHQRDYHGG